MRVGVIGGGQLARMMAPASHEVGIDIRVLVEEIGTSAYQVFGDTIVGQPTLDNLRRIVYGLDGYDPQRTDVLTFEHEFVPNDLIKQIESEGFKVAPSSNALIFAQNKIKMREKMDEIHQQNKDVVNPKWGVVKSVPELASWLRDNHLTDAVLKAPTGGYDGKGVQFVSISNLKPDLIDEQDGKEWLIEEKVNFEFEASVIVACSNGQHNGGIAQFEPYQTSETVQENGVCRTTITPAPNLNKAQAKKAQKIARLIAKTLGVEGILAVEMFWTGTDFIINELAMRPHNTGHWTIDGGVVDQFENHLRGVLGLKLGSTQQTFEENGSQNQYAVMHNILGSDRETLSEALPDVLSLDDRLHVNLYGKGIRPGRKLGHINIVGSDLETMLKVTKEASDIFEIKNHLTKKHPAKSPENEQKKPIKTTEKGEK